MLCMYMNIRDYSTLHLDTNQSKGTVCSNKGYGCIWTRETIQHYTSTQIKVKEQLVVRKDRDVNEIRVITKLPNSEQSYKGKVKINRQNQSTTGKLWETVRDYPTLHLGTH